MNITHLVVHYTATYPDQNPTVEDIHSWHVAAGAREFGYHWYIDREAVLFEGREEGTMGAHARGHNGYTISVVWAGGLDRASGPDVGVWNITPDQELELVRLITDIKSRWPSIEHVVGHVDLVPTHCPGLPLGGVQAWWASQLELVSDPDPADVTKELPPPQPALWRRFLRWLSDC